jgi:hypothetical protein
MRVYVTDHQTDKTWMFEGTPDHIEERLYFEFPWLRYPVEDRGDLQGVLEHLDATHAYEVQIDDSAMSKSVDEPQGLLQSKTVSSQLGFDVSREPAFRAAKFLSDGKVVTPDEERAALYQEDGDLERAALFVYGLQPTEENFKALRAVMTMGDFEKAEQLALKASSVTAAHDEGDDIAEAIRNAYADSFVFSVAMNGKHSSGSMLAYDKQSNTAWLLKSGSGGAGGAAGSKQDPSNPNAREAAWYHIAKEWGIYDIFPRAELIIIDGKMYAALALLPSTYETLDKRNREEPGNGRTVLAPYLHDGQLHQWAVMDFVCGNPDRHGQNVMVDKDNEVKLIDHGSAFAGPAFDPANDKNSFVPYYLRAWAPQDKSFNQLPPEEKAKWLPRVPEAVEKRLHNWVAGLKPEILSALCSRYGIDAQYELSRLERVKQEILQKPTDVVTNSLWVTT